MSNDPIDRYLEDLVEQAGIRVEYRLLRGRDGQSLVDRKPTSSSRGGMHVCLHRKCAGSTNSATMFDTARLCLWPVNAKQERAAEEWGAPVSSPQ